MTEDLLSRLGEYENLLVLARNSAQSYVNSNKETSLDLMHMKGRLVAYTEALNSLHERFKELKSGDSQ